MKKQLKRIMSAMLAVMLVVTALFAAPASEVKAASGITEAAGHLESAYVEWAPISGASGYNVYVRSLSTSNEPYVQLDTELIRQYSGYWRADAVGLKAGCYIMKVVPVINGTPDTSKALTTSTLTVEAHDRTGFAFSKDSVTGGSGIGAYNDDGTLKSDAVVLYVTESTKNSVTMDVKTSNSASTSCTGISAIVKAMQKGYETRPVCIRLIGTVTASGMTGSGDSNNLLLKASSTDSPIQNVTIEGIGEDAVCYGFGIRCQRARSIEIRNLGIMLFGDDGIALETDNYNIWIHNNDVFYGTAGGDADQAKGDGSMDLKNDSKFITISYMHFWDSGKMSLCGMKSETGENWITYHHNWFDHSDSRHPRIRTMSVHVYNNYYDGVAKYGVGVTTGGNAFVEANYFRNCPRPMMISGQGTDVVTGGTFSGENGGMIKAYNNIILDADYLVYANAASSLSAADSKEFDAYLASTRNETVPSSYKTVKGGTSYNNFDTNGMIDVAVDASDVDAPANVPSIVTKYAGRMNNGDFSFTFDNSVDDDSYAINSELMAAVKAYTSSVKSIGGNSVAYTLPTDSVTPQEPTTQAPQETTKAPEATTQAPQETTKAPEATTQAPEETTGSSGGGSTVVEQEYVHNFTTDGKDSSFYTITGNLAEKGDVTYNGLKLTQCLKIESSTSVTFTAPKAGTLTLVFGGSTSAAGKGIKIDGTSQDINSDQILTIDLAAGSHTISKDDSIFLYYMVFAVEGEAHSHSYTATVTKAATCTEAGVKTYTCSCGHSYTEAIAATGHNYSSEWTIDVEATTTTEGSKSRHCTVCDAKTDVTVIPKVEVEEVKNGLINENGTFYYYVDGAVAADYTGLVYSGSIWWYVEKGVLNTGYTGTFTNSGGTWYIINGQLDVNYTGIRYDGTDFWYVVTGKVNTAFVGLYNYADAWWYIKDGKIQADYKGMIDYSGYTWYVAAGKVDITFTGLGLHNGVWYCVQAGKVNMNYSGLVSNGGSWWYVQNGILDTTMTGIVETGGSQWLVATGKLQSTYTGSYTYNGNTYSIVNGKVQ